MKSHKKVSQPRLGYFLIPTMVGILHMSSVGCHFKKNKASFVFFSVPTMVECRRFKLLTSAMRMQRSIS